MYAVSHPNPNPYPNQVSRGVANEYGYYQNPNPNPNPNPYPNQVSHGVANEYGYYQGSVHVLLPRRAPLGEVGGAAPGEACAEPGCWHPPKLLVRRTSNACRA